MISPEAEKRAHEALDALIPGTDVRSHAQSRFVRFLAVFATWLKTGAITLGRSIYTRTGLISLGLKVHEKVHQADMGQTWWSVARWYLAYTFPQNLALLALPALFVSPWLALVCLVALAPWPAPFRARQEALAMAVRARFDRLERGLLGEETQSTDRFWYAGQLTSWVYYKACWRLATAERLVWDAERALRLSGQWTSNCGKQTPAGVWSAVKEACWWKSWPAPQIPPVEVR